MHITHFSPGSFGVYKTRLVCWRIQGERLLDEAMFPRFFVLDTCLGWGSGTEKCLCRRGEKIPQGGNIVDNHMPRMNSAGVGFEKV